MFRTIQRVKFAHNVTNVESGLKCLLCRRMLTKLPICHNGPQAQRRRNVSFWGSSNVTAWSKAVSEAEKIVGYPTSFMSLRCFLSDELSNVAMQMRKLVGTRHPLLKTARKFFYDGKHSMQTRGLLVLLMSKTAGPNPTQESEFEPMVGGIYPRQRSLAEIIEMINTANLIHKGVVNLSQLKASDGSREDMHFGNKMSVLSGDFLLANASTGLAELENTYVVEIISSAIGDLCEADFVKLRDADGNPTLSDGVTMADWEQHTFLSSASLLAKSCKAAVMLAGHPEITQQHAFDFGRHVSLAHQLHDDISSFSGDMDENGSSPNVMSAPVVMFAEKHPTQAAELGLVNNPDLKKVVLEDSDLLEETKQLCREHGQKALDALNNFQESEARTALTNIVKAVTNL